MQDPHLLSALADLHTRRTAGHAGSFLEETANLLYCRLLDELSGRPRFRRVDPGWIADAVTEALFEYCRKPDRFDPARGRTLDRYIALAAHRNVLNAIRSARRRRNHEAIASGRKHELLENDVEVGSPAGNVLAKEAAEAAERRSARILELLKTDMDRRIFELQLRKERRTAVYAEVMGITHLPLAEQRKEVKRAKDRIDKLIERGLSDLDEPKG